MEKFEVIVIGSGSGLTVSSAAASRGLKTAVIDDTPIGGTCLNRGCIPSKMLIHSAEVAETISNATKFGIKSKGYTVDFPSITKRVSAIVDGDAKEIEEGIEADPNTTLFRERAKFVGKNTIQVGKQKIKGEKIVIAAGTRPRDAPIPGLKEAGYLTSKEALRLTKQPKRMLIIGGGYIAAELAHFYGSLGTKVTIFQRGNLLVNREDEEIAQTFTRVFSKKVKVIYNCDTKKVSKKGSVYTVHAEDEKKKKINLQFDQILLAVGRVSNSDTLNLKAGGIKANKFGYIESNEYLETSAKNVWVLGDIAGKYFFKHSANIEASYVVHNMFNPQKKIKVDYTAMPHAVFSSPQIAGVGITEQEARDSKLKYITGKYPYSHTGMGAALQEKDGFVKFIVEKDTKKILGCHIIGPEASTLIHEVILAMKYDGGKLSSITGAIHIHPALSEVVQRAAANVR